MSDQLLIVQLATAIWLLFLAAVAAARLVRGNGHAALVLTCVHFVFFGIPLWLDVIYGGPPVRYQGFADATSNPTVTMTYCFAVAVAPLVWYFASGASSWVPRHSPTAPVRINRLEMVLLFLPLLLVVTIANPTTYATYGAVVQDALDEEALSVQMFVAIASLITVALIAKCIGRSSHLTTAQRLLFVSAGAVALWLNGKRAIIVIATVWVGYALWRRRPRQTIPLLAAIAGIVVVLVAALLSYQWLVRGIAAGDRESYANVRVDYGRDLVLKLALLSEIESGREPVLDYRGQTLVFYSTLPIPRSMWPDKPWPFAVYQTSRMLGIETRSLGWAVTTSWLDESVANFGLAGIFIGPLLLGLICRIGHNAKDPVVDATTTVIALQFLTVQLAAFYPLAAFWAWQRLRAGRAPRNQARIANGFRASIAIRAGHVRWRPTPRLARDHVAAASPRAVQS
jgi:hypothetical protein